MDKSKKQTAVEWLLKKQFDLNMTDMAEDLTKRQYLGQRKSNEYRARDMFKEQIIQAYKEGQWNEKQAKTSLEYITPEEYYNETYGK